MPVAAPPPKFSPSTAAVDWRVKLREHADLARDHVLRVVNPIAWDVFGDIERYDQLLREHTGRTLREAKAFEVGYGARPYRLVALMSMGIDVRGVDMEVPILSQSLQDYREAYHRNGLERVIKSAAQLVVSNWRDEQRLRRALSERGHTMRVDRERMLVGDAAKVELEPASLDLIYSEDVFEHIERGSLEQLMPKMREWLKPDGLALIRPNVYTGITGGHLVEYNRRSFLTPGRKRRSRPWAHLLDEGFQTNTYLNRLHRRDYREIFSREFEILHEEVALPDLGRDLLTDDLRRQIDLPEEEIFSNQILFVLRPR